MKSCRSNPGNNNKEQERYGKVIGFPSQRAIDDEQTRSKDPKEPSLPLKEGGKNNRVQQKDPSFGFFRARVSDFDRPTPTKARLAPRSENLKQVTCLRKSDDYYDIAAAPDDLYKGSLHTIQRASLTSQLTTHR